MRLVAILSSVSGSSLSAHAVLDGPIPAVYFGVYYPPEPTTPPDTPDWLIALGEHTPHCNVVMIDSFSNFPPA